jgi:hypothetical protein
VSGISLAGTNDLNSITPVSKTVFLDIAADIQNAGQIIPEKLEGLTIGTKLNDGTYSISELIIYGNFLDFPLKLVKYSLGAAENEQ